MSAEYKGVLLDGRVVDLAVRDGRIAAIEDAAGPASRVALPLPVDAHIHLDKTFTAERCKAAGPGLFGAIEAVEADLPNWTEDDLRSRMFRALAEAEDNGFTALRSHVDWLEPKAPPAWGVLGELAQDWRDRITVQRASLASLDLMGDPEAGRAVAAAVARDGGVLGCFVYLHGDLDARLENVFKLADEHDLWLDFHVDEGLDAGADAFDRIVALAGRYEMAGRVLCGHACSLSVRDEGEVSRAIDAAARAGVALTVLPTTNLWLQDGGQGRTPRRRGLAPVHELREAGVPVLLGSDNVADPFYPYGSYDALEVLRLASVAAQLSPGDWLDAVTSHPAKAMGLDVPSIEPGGRANFLVVEGSDWREALRSPHARRQVVRSGRPPAGEREAA